jgi:hypothetical protein
MFQMMQGQPNMYQQMMMTQQPGQMNPYPQFPTSQGLPPIGGVPQQMGQGMPQGMAGLSQGLPQGMGHLGGHGQPGMFGGPYSGQ